MAIVVWMWISLEFLSIHVNSIAHLMRSPPTGWYSQCQRCAIIYRCIPNSISWGQFVLDLATGHCLRFESAVKIFGIAINKRNAFCLSSSSSKGCKTCRFISIVLTLLIFHALSAIYLRNIQEARAILIYFEFGDNNNKYIKTELNKIKNNDSITFAYMEWYVFVLQIIWTILPSIHKSKFWFIIVYANFVSIFIVLAINLIAVSCSEYKHIYIYSKLAFIFQQLVCSRTFIRSCSRDPMIFPQSELHLIKCGKCLHSYKMNCVYMN